MRCQYIRRKVDVRPAKFIRLHNAGNPYRQAYPIIGVVRRIWVTGNGVYIHDPEISVGSTGDGLITDICIDLEFKPITNADKIRSMTDEELADLFHNTVTYKRNEADAEREIDIFFEDKSHEVADNFGSLLEWLQSETESEEKENE